MPPKKASASTTGDASAAGGAPSAAGGAPSAAGGAPSPSGGAPSAAGGAPATRSIKAISETIIARFKTAADVPAKTRVFNEVLQEMGSAIDIMIARGGDLTHDIGKEMLSKIIIAGLGGGGGAAGGGGGGRYSSMIEYITTVATPEITGRVNGYTSHLSNVMPDLNEFARTNFVAKCILRKGGDFPAYTTELKGLLFDTVVLDSQFGNLFTEGFGDSWTLLNASVSELDGATKVKGEGALGGMRREEQYDGFEVPFFYSDLRTHTITTETTPGTKAKPEIKIKKNYVTGTTADGTFKLSCASGLSVNAICKLTGLDAPRGTGEAAKPINLDSSTPGLRNLGNHIVFIKTLTDWAQIVFVFYQNYVLGRKTVFITNDEYCLALAAALRLPIVIRTPSTKSDVVQVSIFNEDYFTITAAEKEIIRRGLSTGITPADAATLTETVTTVLAKTRAAMVVLPASMQTLIDSRLVELNADIVRYIADLPPRAAAAVTEALIQRYRYLLRVTPRQYVEEILKQSAQKIYNTIVYFSSQIETQRKNLDSVTKRTTLDDIYSIIESTFYGNTNLVKEIFQTIDLTKTPNPERTLTARAQGWKQTVKDFLATKEIDTEIASTVKINLLNTCKTVLMPLRSVYVDFTLPIDQQEEDYAVAVGGSLQRGGALPDAIQEEITAAVRKYTVPIKDAYKPSLSEKVSSLVKTLAYTDPFEKHMQKIIDVLDAMKIDAYETNLEKEYGIALSNIEGWVAMVKKGKMTATELSNLVSYLVWVDYDMATIIPYVLDPDTERPLLASAIQTIASYDKRNTAEGIPKNIRNIQAKKFQERAIVPNTPTQQPPLLNPPQYVYSTTAGGRRRNRRTKKRTASRRRRTIRRRK